MAATTGTEEPALALCLRTDSLTNECYGLELQGRDLHAASKSRRTKIPSEQLSRFEMKYEAGNPYLCTREKTGERAVRKTFNFQVLSIGSASALPIFT